MLVNIAYKDKLKIVLNNEDEPFSITCHLPVVGEGQNRIVYDLGDDKVLKVAKSETGALANLNEINLFNKLRNRRCKIHINHIYDADENAYWYVAEKINMSFEADSQCYKMIPFMNFGGLQSGYNTNGELTIVDAEGLHYTCFTIKTKTKKQIKSVKNLNADKRIPKEWINDVRENKEWIICWKMI